MCVLWFSPMLIWFAQLTRAFTSTAFFLLSILASLAFQFHFCLDFAALHYYCWIECSSASSDAVQVCVSQVAHSCGTLTWKIVLMTVTLNWIVVGSGVQFAWERYCCYFPVLLMMAMLLVVVVAAATNLSTFYINTLLIISLIMFQELLAKMTDLL